MLSKFNIKLNGYIYKKCIINYFQNYNSIKILTIDLNSPLLNILSKEKYFYKNFFIEIPLDKIKELKEETPQKFDNFKKRFYE